MNTRCRPWFGPQPAAINLLLRSASRACIVDIRSSVLAPTSQTKYLSKQPCPVIASAGGTRCHHRIDSPVLPERVFDRNSSLRWSTARISAPPTSAATFGTRPGGRLFAIAHAPEVVPPLRPSTPPSSNQRRCKNFHELCT